MPLDHSKYRADSVPCFISGVQGAQPMRVGIAYFYRGHYIYSMARTPIEPQPFATKGRLMVAGTTIDTAPLYDQLSPTLAPEPSIGFLYKAQLTDRYYSLDGARAPDHDPELAAHAYIDNGHSHSHSHASSHMHLPTPIIIEPDDYMQAHDTTFSSSSRLHSHSRAKTVMHGGDCRGSMLKVNTNLPSVSFAPQLQPSVFTPHDRAHYLAYSAPGSKFVSRAASPSNEGDEFEEDERSFLCPVLSTTRLGNLTSMQLGSLLAGGGISLLDAGAGAGSGARTPPATEWMTDEAISTFMYNPASPSPPTTTAPSLSRPRRASFLLNKAYNATHHPQLKVLKCPLHDGACDGVSVAEPHLTEQCRLRSGFKDLYPVLREGGRTMIDWAQVVREERARMRR